jgi:diguanylate cyclase (GGDEF)-like protein/PAS domain S-box-containing protein
MAVSLPAWLWAHPGVARAAQDDASHGSDWLMLGLSLVLLVGVLREQGVLKRWRAAFQSARGRLDALRMNKLVARDAAAPREATAGEGFETFETLDPPAQAVFKPAAPAQALKRAASMFEHCGEGMFVADHHWLIQEVNIAMCALTGCVREELLGRSPELLSAALRDEVQRKGKWSGEIIERHKNGALIPLWATVVRVPPATPEAQPEYVAVLADISRIKKSEAALKHQALHDPLTGLPNLALLRDRIERQITVAQREHTCVAVLYVDLDSFRDVNDSAGHAAGDEVLRIAAARFQDVVRASDSVARVGSDEFVVVLCGLVDEESAMRLGERLIEAMQAPIQIGDARFNMGASIGLALFPADGITVDDLLRNADAAMCRAKVQARCTVQAYRPELTRAVQQRVELTHAMRQALDEGQFYLHYQPQVRLSDGLLIGAEALLRWQHPTRGNVSPVEFIPLAESSGLIVPLGRWVLHEACMQATRWLGRPGHPQIVAVNVSARQMLQPDFVEVVEATLAATGCPPQALELEVTESMFLDDAERAIDLLTQLTQRGVRVAIDDFGTGYSSLSYLKRMPVQTLKIDRSFVRDLPGDNNVAAIARTVIALARTLRLDVLAEGVETEAQADWLREEGCDWAQGYFYGKAQAPELFGL